MLSVESRLRERIKELRALHQMAGLLRRDDLGINEALNSVVKMIPSSWQFPEICAAKIVYNQQEFKTYNYQDSEWKQISEFISDDKISGHVEVCYLKVKPEIDEGPFLREERELIDSLAEMICIFIQRHEDRRNLLDANDRLEKEVQKRTNELNKTVEALKKEVKEHLETRKQILEYQAQLQKLTIDLSLAEEREKHAFASDLHDHIGQGLAFIKIKLNNLKERFMFTGVEEDLNQLMDMLNRTIYSTRTLTFDISPPVLYELGLVAALEWLAERFSKQHKLKIDVKVQRFTDYNFDEKLNIILFKFARELLINVIKHAKASKARISLEKTGTDIILTVSDNGTGFPEEKVINSSNSDTSFGLYSIRERLRYLEGKLEILPNKRHGSIVKIEIPLN